jgi:hypothetical protein
LPLAEVPKLVVFLTFAAIRVIIDLAEEVIFFSLFNLVFKIVSVNVASSILVSQLLDILSFFKCQRGVVTDVIEIGLPMLASWSLYVV